MDRHRLCKCCATSELNSFILEQVWMVEERRRHEARTTIEDFGGGCPVFYICMYVCMSCEREGGVFPMLTVPL